MKLRNGFVSNSSSSSFVIALTKKKDQYTVQELQQELFADKDYLPDTCAYEEGTFYAASRVAAAVLEGMLPVTISYLECSDDRWGHAFDCAECDDRFSEASERKLSELARVMWAATTEGEKTEAAKAYRDAVRAADAEQEARADRNNIEEITRFAKRTEGKFYYEVGFSDNDGDFGAFCEHGNIFQNIPFLVENNH
jgi:hypothetical protein